MHAFVAPLAFGISLLITVPCQHTSFLQSQTLHVWNIYVHWGGSGANVGKYAICKS